MTDPELCDDCLCTLDHCLCVRPPPGERRPARTPRLLRVPLGAEIWRAHRADLARAGATMTGHDPGDEHADLAAQ